MDYINKNINKLPEYPFQKLRILLKNLNRNEEIIDLSIGQPMHKTPDFVATIIHKEKKNWHVYPPLSGLKVLRDSYKNWLTKRFIKDCFINENNILPLSGTKEGLFSISMALNIKNIIVPNPFYQVYLGASLFGNTKNIFLLSNESNNYLIDLKKLKSELNKGPALIYFCSPTNPQGKIADSNFIEELIKITRYYKSVLVIDECYIDIYYKKKPTGTLEVCNKLGKKLDNVLIFHSLSKRSNVAGLRSGFVTGDEKIIKLFKKLRNYSAPTIPIPLQIASAMLWKDDKHVKENREKYLKKILLADKLFAKYKFYKSPEAGFFLWLKVEDGEEFTKSVYSRYGLKVMPGKYLAYGKKNNPGKNFIRIALVHDYNKNKNALIKITKMLKC